MYYTAMTSHIISLLSKLTMEKTCYAAVRSLYYQIVEKIASFGSGNHETLAVGSNHHHP